MQKEFFGSVKRNVITNNNRKYSIIEMKNSENLNYRIFVPGELVLGSKFQITLKEIV